MTLRSCVSALALVPFVALATFACDGKAPAPDAAAPATDVAGTAPEAAALTPDAAANAADATALTPDAAAPSAPEKVASVEGITEYRLGNGLRVLLFPDPSKTTATVNITYMVGSRSEGYGESGMAHLLEHMLFKGTPTHPEIWAEMQKRGAEFNGTTDYDRTNYYETFTATDDNLAWALELEADRMINSKIAAEALATEFSVVRNEFESGENDPNAILYERILASAYLWHNYGKSPIGAKSDIERVPAASLHAFYARYYQPDNAVLVVAGKIDPDKTLAQVNTRFGAIPRPTRVLPTSYTVEPVQDGEREVILRRNGDTQIIGLAYHTVAGSDADYAASEAVGHLLASEPSGRLYAALVKTGLATRVWSMQQPLAEPGTILFFATVPVDKPMEPVKAAMLAAIEGFSDPTNPANAPTEAELTRFKAEAAKSFNLLMSDNQQAAVRLTDWQALGDWRLMFLTRDRMQALTPAQVGAFAAAYLKPSNRTLGLFVPDKAADRAPLPARPDVAALVKDYQGKAAVATGEAFEATVPVIEARTKRTTAGSVKLALLSKTTSGGIVHAQLVLHYGNKATLTGHTTAANLVPEMLMRGTTKRTFEQLQDELTRLQAEVAISSAGTVPQPGLVTATLKTTRDNLAAVMALLAEILKTPSFAEDQFAILKAESLTQLEEQRANPQAVAITAGIRKLMPLPPDDLRYMPTMPEAIERMKAVTLDELKRFHADHYGASNAEMAFVGDFDAAAVEKLVMDLFASWPSQTPFERVPAVFTASLGGTEVIDTPDKEGGFVISVQAFELRDDHADYPALVLANYILGGGGSSRLNNRLRQKDGVSYGAFSQLFASPIDMFGVFFAGALGNPANANKALAALLEEAALLIDKGVPADELAEAQKGWASQFDTELADDGAVVDKLVGGLFIGRTLTWEQDLNARIAALRADDLKAVLAKGHLKIASLGSVVAADQKKAAGP